MTRAVLLAWFVGVLVGTLAGWLLSPSSEVTLSRGPEPPALGSETPSALDIAAAENADEPSPPGAGLAGLNPSPEEREFLKSVLTAERERRRAAMIQPDDSGRSVMKRILDHGASPTSAFESFDRFSSHVSAGNGPLDRFESATAGELKFNELEPISRVIEFGPGRFEIRRGFWIRDDEHVEELEIRGAGMEQTELVVDGLVNVTGKLDNLRVRDLALTGGGPSLDVRGEIAAVVERVSFRNWPSGGHSAAIGISGRAYAGFKDCEFLAGPESGMMAFSIRGQSVALFENCLFADCAMLTRASGPAAVSTEVLFRGCTFENTRLSDSALLGLSGCHVRVDSCQVHWGPPSLSLDERRKRWGLELTASATAVTFGPELIRWSVRDMVEALTLIRPTATDEVIVRVEHASPYAYADTLLGVHYVRENGRESRAVFLRRNGDRFETAARGGDRRQTRSVAHDELVEALPLEDILRRSQLAPGTAIEWLEYYGKPLEVRAGFDRHTRWRWNAHTGDPID